MSFFNIGNRKNHVAQRPNKPRRLMTETLEDRQLLAVGVFSADVVDTANVIELGPNDLNIQGLKAAIEAAAQTTSNDIVKIPAATFELASAADEITIDIPTSKGGLWIVAEGGDVVFDAAGANSRVFSVKNGNITFEGITILNGSADYGAGIANGAALTLLDVTMQDNTASVSGGAIANKGTLAVYDSLITNNVSGDGGSALYEGQFDWPVNAPQWQTIPAQVGGKGTTLTVNLADYVNAGNWNYSFSVGESTSSILKSAPTLDNAGNLSFTFIGDDDYYGEDDYSALSVTVTASDGENADSATFSVAIAEQTSVTVAAILSNKTYEETTAEYLQGTVKRPLGYAADEIPAPTIIDTTATTTLQIWMQDNDWTGNNLKMWDAGDYAIMGMEYRLHLENATVAEFTERTGLCRDAYVYRQLDNGDYEFIIAYVSGANFGYTEALLLDVLTLQPIDATQPVSATVYQINTDWTFPCYTRLYDSPTPRDPARSHINVDPSQTLFVSTISNSTQPLSAIPGQPFDTNIVRQTTSNAILDFSNAVAATTTTTPKAYLYNVTIANNLSRNNGGAIYASTATLCSVYNSIVALNNGGDVVRTGSGKISAYNVLSGFTGWTNAANVSFAYDPNAPLFNNADARDYTLAENSQALDAGDNQYVDTLVDIVGASRIQNQVVDLGAYETSLFNFSYDASTRVLTLNWESIPGAVTYTVKISKNGGETWATYKSRLTETTTNVAGIYVGKSYMFRVSGVSASGATLAAVQEGTFAPIAIAPTAPSYENGDAITIKLTGAAGAAASCQWFYMTEDGDVEIPEAAGLTTYVPTQSQYDVKVVATGTGISKGSVAETTIRSVVPKLTFDYNPDNRQAVLNWVAIPDAVTYTVKVSKDAGATWLTYRSGLTDATTTAAGLYVGKSYAYTVYGINASGATLQTTRSATLAPISITANMTEYAAGEPINIALKGASNSAASIKWYYVTPNGDVEIVDARGKLSYAPTEELYDIKVVATGIGDSRGSNYSVRLDAPAPTANVAYDANAQQATLTWGAVGAADSYTVQYTNNGGATWTVVAQNTASTSVTIENLTAGKSYDFQIVANGADGGVVRTVETTFAPFAVKANLDAYMAGDTITLSVTAATNASYEIQWYLVTPNGDMEIVEAAGLTNYTPTDAYFDLKAVVTGTGDSTGEVVEILLSNDRSVGDVTLRTYNSGSSQSIIQWDAIANATNGYKVMISKDGGKTWLRYAQINDPAKTFVAVNGTYPGKSYLFKVYGINGTTLTSSTREGTIEPIKIFTNGKPYYNSTPKNVGLQAANPDNVEIRWYYITDNGDVEITEARNQLSYKITTRTNEIRVVATGSGASAGFVSAVNIPRPNSVITFSPVVSSKSTLTWDPLPGASTYIVKRSVDGGATWVTYRKDLTTNSCEANGLYAGKTYLFSVVGYDANGKQMLSSMTGSVDRATTAASVVDDVFADFFEEDLFVE